MTEHDDDPASAAAKEVVALAKSYALQVGAPYGFKLSCDGMHWVPDRAEQEIIRRYRELRNAGLPTRKIIAEFEERGLLSRKGKPR